MKIAVALSILFGLSACDTSEPQLALGSSHRASILNGTTETGYAGVGALLVDHGGGDVRLCTGTAIATDWVLTAAHCIDGVEAVDVLFTSAANIEDMAADWYLVRSLHPHSMYVAATPTTPVENDIALVNVIGLNDVPTYALNSSSLNGMEGTVITWVGYGLNTTSPDAGDGIKRRGEGSIGEVSMFQLINSYAGVLPCRGDAGAPAFAQIGGSQRLVSVVSSGGEFCDSYSLETRVDPYLSWIDTTIAGTTSDGGGTDGGLLTDGGFEPDGGPVGDAMLMGDPTTSGDPGPGDSSNGYTQSVRPPRSDDQGGCHQVPVSLAACLVPVVGIVRRRR